MWYRIQNDTVRDILLNSTETSNLPCLCETSPEHADRQEQPEEFHESLRQIPMRWRSSLSSIMTSMASNGGIDEQGGESGSRAADMDVAGGDGKGVGAGGERKVSKLWYESYAVP